MALQQLEGLLAPVQMQDLQAILGADANLDAEVDKTKAQYRKQIKALNDEIKALGDENNSLMTRVNGLKFLKDGTFDALLDIKSITRQEEIDALQKEVNELMGQLTVANNTLAQVKANNAPLESWNSYWEQQMETSKQMIWGEQLRADYQRNAPRGNEH